MGTMIRPAITALPASRIREVANAGLGRNDILKFWFGEGDRLTPPFIRAAAQAAIEAGDVFYNPNLGLPELREAIAAHLSQLYRPAQPLPKERITVTSAGVHALMLISQALVEPGDRVVVVTPVWPNVTAIPTILGGVVERVALDYEAGRWSLDLGKLLAATRPGTRMLVINSPNNPTGWTLSQADWRIVREHCARHGIWLIADDAYARLVYDGQRVAPGLLGEIGPDERFVSASTFSKAWSMTGWRLGWICGPADFIVQVGKLTEFNTSCVPAFVQRAGIAAIEQGEPFVADSVARLARARERLVAGLQRIDGVEVAPPAGAMYGFFRVPGRSDDSLAFAKGLVASVGLGLAPGVAFGPEGEGWLRWCFSASEDRIDDGLARLATFLAPQTKSRAT